MRKVGLNIVLFLSISIFLLSLTVEAQPTEKSLIEAWEAIQREDSKTVVFEKVEERLYKFKTERFPFDGELKVLNVIIDDRMGDFEYGYIIGIIEVELVDLAEDFHRKYAQSYSMWAQTNTLYYDKEADRWMSSKEYYAKSADQAKKFPFWPGSLWNFLDPALIILVIFLIILLLFSRKATKASKVYMDSAMEVSKKSLELSQTAIALHEETNKLLKKIAEGLKNKNRQ